jgi:hypothetical protein
MEYYHNILNLLSLVMVVAILFIVLFGCQFKKYRRYERFTNLEDKDEGHKNKDNDNDDEYEDKNKVKPDIKPKQEIKKETDETDKEDKFTVKDTLEGFEGQILSGLSSGSLTTSDMDKLINAGTFTKENLENIISYVEKFKSLYS